jgi:hypothetical protein
MTDTETKPMPVYVAETWIAVGTRVVSGKRSQGYLDPQTEGIRYWPDRVASIIGGQYELKVERREGAVYRTGSPRYLGPSGSPQRAEWELASEAAERRLRSEAAERRDKRQGGKIDEVCRPLCELAATIRNYEDIERLLTSVRRRVFDAWDKK